ncbi:MAG: S41 family peptidase [Bacilli bacterium]|nr:S41 family peptidase [Bacilli bacterium]MDD4733361.1 S41 family peptidase [Bacilli bacterium]
MANISKIDKNKKKATKIEENKASFGTIEVIGLVLITCIVSLVFGYSLNFFSRQNNEKYVAVDETLQEFITNYNEVVDNYYGDLSKKDLLEAAFKAILLEIDDKYTGLIDMENNSVKISLDGEYQGIGIEIKTDKEQNIVVNKIFENSPASQVDIKQGDIITKINETVIDKFFASQVSELISVQGDNEFTLELKRNNNTFSVKLKRGKIELNPVVHKMIEEDNAKIGYIKLKIFSANSYNFFETALKELENKKMETLIIDLRDNSGGQLFATENIMDLFVDSSKIVYQIKKDNKISKTYSDGKETKKYPIVVLTNGESASASEMLTGMLKDNLDVYIVGENTYGKGTVQDVNSFGDLRYKYTSMEWLTPKGTSVNEVGIKPDLKVTASQEYIKNPTSENDNQLQSAIDYIIGKR